MKQLSLAVAFLAVAVFVGASVISKRRSADIEYLTWQIKQMDSRVDQVINALSAYDPAFTSSRFMKTATKQEAWLDSVTLARTNWLDRYDLMDVAYLLPENEQQKPNLAE